MALQYYNRYSTFLINGQQTVVPFVQVPQKTTDKTEWNQIKHNGSLIDTSYTNLEPQLAHTAKQKPTPNPWIKTWNKTKLNLIY
jgi:hypothetical protein